MCAYILGSQNAFRRKLILYCTTASNLIMVLWLNRPLTEMSTKNHTVGGKRSVPNLTTNCEPTV
jgi:hypothetical protein